MRFNIKTLLLLHITVALTSVQGCAGKSDAKPLPVAQWQFIDAETMKPIEGAFVNFAWRGKPTERGLQTCKRGILGRSDSSGWFRNTALDASWRADPIPAFFVPGYEAYSYKYGYPDKDHITHYIREDANSEFGRYPAWEKRWADMGYVFQGESSAYYLDWHAWTKTVSSSGFHDFKKDPENPKLYFMKMRTIPGQVDAAFSFVGKTCSDDDATNQVDRTVVREADYLRGYHSTKYFCDPAWNSLRPGRWDMSPWLTRAFFVVPDRNSATVNSAYQGILGDYHGDRNLTAEERKNFCVYIQRFLKQGELL
jgi:hypothetical protein